MAHQQEISKSPIKECTGGEWTDQPAAYWQTTRARALENCNALLCHIYVDEKWPRLMFPTGPCTHTQWSRELNYRLCKMSLTPFLNTPTLTHSHTHTPTHTHVSRPICVEQYVLDCRWKANRVSLTHTLTKRHTSVCVGIMETHWHS